MPPCKEKMKGIRKHPPAECLYLSFSHQSEGCVFPLHTAVSLFLLAYCDCKVFKVYLVLTEDSEDLSRPKSPLAQGVQTHVISRHELPPIVQNCRLPAVVEKPDNFCRAGLAVVLRHIIQTSYDMDPSRKEILELLGFKKTCLKACAEVSQWTRLCELTVPLAIESFLQGSPQPLSIPTELQQLERKLREPVRVHNDDKLRRQKLKQQQAEGPCPAQPQHPGAAPNLELQVAFSKLGVQEEPAAARREPPHVRKARASELPPLEHVFAEGLYFTLADIVLLPCVHLFLVTICKKLSEKLVEFPLLTAWYQRVQEVPRVKTAASQCGIHFLHLPESLSSAQEQHPEFVETLGAEEPEEQSEPPFIGGPRPTMTKLREKGIEVMFAPHPCPTWTLDWDSLPAAASPKEGVSLGPSWQRPGTRCSGSIGGLSLLSTLSLLRSMQGPRPS
ncbi:glutathione S-transferase C-terminal domain-containing protein-like isoform X1 [Sorex fumeus]|uniref:glutathione S-transferase C-terminal domain-containing protein-like isoform X2 n=2 Tax=Sorex fumeus TaxID=62283 RepID=UPI0024ACF311|nr:glutathione S-transferase C-terminal domain-containing protein-like isoform X2 [Sorex fumeus]XP_055969796.1 glutathione S-transferase C-terminal domain-containing protein-like isoform X1 [Sorex fumeus]